MVSNDGRRMPFESARNDEPAGVGHGIFHPHVEVSAEGAIAELVGDGACVDGARTLGERVRAETGVRTARDAIERLLFLT